MKIATFNVNSIRARIAAVTNWLANNKPDVLCLQETKVQDQDFPMAEITATGYQVISGVRNRITGWRFYPRPSRLTCGSAWMTAYRPTKPG